MDPNQETVRDGESEEGDKKKKKVRALTDLRCVRAIRGIRAREDGTTRRWHDELFDPEPESPIYACKSSVGLDNATDSGGGA